MVRKFLGCTHLIRISDPKLVGIVDGMCTETTEQTKLTFKDPK